MKFEVCLTAMVAVGVALLAQGCGGGNSSDDATSTATTTSTMVTTSTTTASTTTTTTTSTTAHPPRKPHMTQPLSVGEAVQKLNELFQGYNPDDSTSPLGVTISWLKDQDKKLNLYCPYVAGDDSNGCYDGSSSCRMSCINHNKNLPMSGGRIVTFSGRRVGVVFRQELVEKYFGKCAYMYDGASNNRYNFGCGNLGRADCDSPVSPFSNVCPSTNKPCTTSDIDVSVASCDRIGGHASAHHMGCFYKGVAYNVSMDEMLTHYDGTTMWNTTSQLRAMVDDRNSMQKTFDCGDMCWNEVILDERLILTQLWWDPATVVDAFVYKRGDDWAKGHATDLQKAFQRDWNVSPSVIAFDRDCVACAPFSAPEAELVI